MNELIATLSKMSTEQLRKVWSAACRVGGFSTDYAMNWLPDTDAIRHYASIGDSARATAHLVSAVQYRLMDNTPGVKTGKQITEMGAFGDYVTRAEFAYDFSGVEVKIAAILAAGK